MKFVFDENPYFSNAELERTVEFNLKKSIVSVKSTEPIWKQGMELNSVKASKEFRNKSNKRLLIIFN